MFLKNILVIYYENRADAYSVLAKSLQGKNIEEAFSKFDANNDGWVDAMELRQAMKSFGQHAEHLSGKGGF